MAYFKNTAVNSVIFNSLTRPEGLQPLLERLTETFSLDIYVINTDGRLLFGAAALETKRQFNTFPARAVANLFSGNGKCVHERLHGYDRLLCPLFTPAAVLSGAIIIHYCPPLDQEFAESLGRSLARVYHYLYPDQGNGYTLNFRNQIIARYLLLRENTAEINSFIDTYLQDYSLSGMIFRQRFAVAVFRPAEPDAAVSEKEGTPLSRFIPNCFYVKDGSRLLALIFGLDGDRVGANAVLCSSLEDYCASRHLVCAVSRVFDDLNDRAVYIRQASALLDYELSVPAERVYLAEDRFSDMILAGATAQLGGKMFLLSDISRLVEYDRENNTRYSETLESYLDCAGNYTQAASALYIDRGTLKYRLEKIKKILSCDPDKPEDAKRLIIAMQIYRHFSSPASK